jgi:hypothetical protein
MALPINDYLIDDAYKPLVSKPSLQQYDNYQIYSIVGIDYPHNYTFLDSVPTAYVSFGGGVLVYEASYNMQLTQLSNTIQSGEFSNFIAYQQYSTRPITLDFKLLANKIAAIPTRTTHKSSYISAVNTLASTHFQAIITGANPVFTQYQATANQNNATLANQFSFVKTISGGGTTYVLMQWIYTPTGIEYPKITLDALLDGYGVKTKPSNPVITPSIDGEITISYYRINRLESVPKCRSIDWTEYKINIRKNKPVYLPIIDIVFGTLVISGNSSVVADVKNKLAAINLPADSYKYTDYYPSSIDNLISQWLVIYNQYPDYPLHPDRYYEDSKVYQSPILRLVAANNNHWNNDPGIKQDINYDPNHQVFLVNNQRAYDWHIKPQSDGSFGDLVMHSPMLEEIHAAIGAGTWGINPDDPLTPRVDNLGWRTARTNDVLGIRVKTDGTIDKVSEAKLVRQVIAKDKVLDPNKVGINGFGDDGMALKRINNRFNKDGIVSDQCVIIHDIPQKLDEYFDQINLALGIQESSAVQIVAGDKVARFNNQLEILVELLHLLSSMNEMTRSNLVSSLVTQSQSNEIIGGLGLPSVTKTIPIKIGKSVSQLPFKGIAAHRSISQEIATCTYNVGLVTGQLL